jgi:S-disulfanyl-L-cysteine oxidoreductase SoxD
MTGAVTSIAHCALAGSIGFVVLLAACESQRSDGAQAADGAQLYALHCASCHGANLEGQPNWRQRLPNGRMPAPPHDESGHTWHHPDKVLFGITKHGLAPPFAPAGYETDMPAFGGKLRDAEIRAVLAFIASHWTSKEVLETRAEMVRNSK